MKTEKQRTITLGTMPSGEHYVTIRDRGGRLWVWSGQRFEHFIIPRSMRAQAKLYTNREDLFLDLNIILSDAQFEINTSALSESKAFDADLANRLLDTDADDAEAAHVKADDMLADALEKLSLSRSARAYRKVRKRF